MKMEKPILHIVRFGNEDVIAASGSPHSLSVFTDIPIMSSMNIAGFSFDGTNYGVATSNNNQDEFVNVLQNAYGMSESNSNLINFTRDTQSQSLYDIWSKLSYNTNLNGQYNYNGNNGFTWISQ